eukprot:GHVT01026342.1.p1 GENE.GHVT01026342.1~~GHVT01026342.1.p1  ORF type:complete len:429 (+),score=43.84 GHVT01026342.1:294-1580(+)
MSVWGGLVRVSTFGESHGCAVGCVLEGLPGGMALTEADIQPQLTRRRPGQSVLTTQRQEVDQVKILSGTENGFTLGTPIALIVNNADQRKHDYANVTAVPRPGHGDYTYEMKYGIKASSGGGRSSARETLARVAAGAVCEKWLKEEYGTQIVTWVSAVGDIKIPIEVTQKFEASPPTRSQVDEIGTLRPLGPDHYMALEDDTLYDSNTGEMVASDNPAARALPPGDPIPTRCVHAATAAKIAVRIKEVRAAHDSIGGVVTTVVSQCPVGLGEPCFDKVEAELAKAAMSLPATKGFEIGEGFQGAAMLGSQHNDCFEKAALVKQQAGQQTILSTKTNHAGGTLGGITSGQNLVFRVAVKPVSSIGIEQETCDFEGNPTTLGVKGRHDPCVLPRVPPLMEGMTAIVLADLAMRQRARHGAKGPLPTLTAC